MKALLLVLTWVALLGCDETRVGSIDTLESAELRERLATDCAQIAAHGDLKDLLRRFDALSEQLVRLSGPPLTAARLEQLRRAQEDHERTAIQLQSLLRDEWTEALWPLRLRWKLSDAGTTKTLRPAAILTQRALFAGLRWPQGLDALRIEGDDLVLERAFSSIEACRMVRGLVLWVDVSDERAPTRVARSFRLTLSTQKENHP